MTLDAAIGDMIVNLSRMVVITGEMVDALSMVMLSQHVVQTIIIVVALYLSRRRGHD